MTFDKICGRKVRAFFVCTGLAVVFLFSAVPVNFSHAQGRFLREEWKLPDFYPRGFDGYGKIESIAKEGIVIDDTALKFSQQIRYATPRDPNAGLHAFSVGDTVAYLLNQDREIISLWFIEFRKAKKNK
jgi:hypothetical protein